MNNVNGLGVSIRPLNTYTTDNPSQPKRPNSNATANTFIATAVYNNIYSDVDPSYGIELTLPIQKNLVLNGNFDYFQTSAEILDDYGTITASRWNYRYLNAGIGIAQYVPSLLKNVPFSWGVSALVRDQDFAYGINPSLTDLCFSGAVTAEWPKNNAFTLGYLYGGPGDNMGNPAPASVFVEDAYNFNILYSGLVLPMKVGANLSYGIPEKLTTDANFWTKITWRPSEKSDVELSGHVGERYIGSYGGQWGPVFAVGLTGLGNCAFNFAVDASGKTGLTYNVSLKWTHAVPWIK